MLKKFFLACLFMVLCSTSVYAKSVIFMIGDGMGYNHIDCVNEEVPLFMSSLEPGYVQTASADHNVTDSAASATAYACGIKTNNKYLGMTPKGDKCETIAEKAVSNDMRVYIITTDNEYGATPSAFYAHTDSRDNKEDIAAYRKAAAKTMKLAFNVPSAAEATAYVLEQMDKDPYTEYFVMIEGAKIDKASHFNDYDWMVQELVDFDKAVEMAWKFADTHNVAVIVTADHETGSFREDNCDFGSREHSDVDVPIYTKGLYRNIKSTIDNTKVYELIKDTLF